MKIRIVELEKHVRKLAREHGVKIRWTTKKHPDHESANHNDRCILIGRIRTKHHYAVALHEIGHLATKSRHLPILYQEGVAWAWAKERALVWTPTMQRSMICGLRTYLTDALRQQPFNRPSNLKLPPRSHPFWEFLKQEPEVRRLLKRRTPPWLSKELIATPWATILNHPERPRCSNCGYWKQVAKLPTNDTSEKLTYGACVHIHRPLGVEMTPAGALCGVSYERKLLP